MSVKWTTKSLHPKQIVGSYYTTVSHPSRYSARYLWLTFFFCDILLWLDAVYYAVFDKTLCIIMSYRLRFKFTSTVHVLRIILSLQKNHSRFSLTSFETWESESSTVKADGWTWRPAMFSGQNLWADFVLPLLDFGFGSTAAAPAESNIGCRIRRRPFINLPAHKPTMILHVTNY